MNEYRHHVRSLAAAALLALVAACTSMSPDARRLPSGTQADGAASESGQLEEITVTGSRVVPGRRDRSTFAPSLAAPTPLPSGAALDRVQGIGPADEIWFIAVPDGADEGPGAGEDRPGSGALVATVPGSDPNAEPTTVPLPLEHTDVSAAIRGYVGIVDVRQEFRNPYAEKIEAVYLFPLPENAAVREFVMAIGDRQIRGILREKEEAEQLYHEARAQGYRASLLVQQRPNVFEQKVANIEPGKRIDVAIRYFHTLPYHDGWYAFVFPAVVGPRYNPPGWQDPVGALPRGAVFLPGRGRAVRYLRPGERSAHDLAISVDLDAGVPIEAVDASHPIETVREADHKVRIALADEDTIPNRDFVLRFKVAGDEIRSKLLTWRDPETNEGYFTMMVHPPADVSDIPRQPVEMVFVIDTSSSMNGRPIEQAKEAVLTALERLRPDDTFQIIRFANEASPFGPEPVPATAENLRAARAHVEQLDVSGGTEMIAGIRAALAFAHDERRLRFVTFLTDGYIGNEAQIIGEVHRLIGEARIFSFGVGNAVNRYLLERLASEGRGAVAYLGLDDSADEVMGYFFDRISRPALTDLEIDFGEMRASEIYPSRLPDLFVGRAVVVTGRFAGEPDGVTVRGRVRGEPVELSISAADAAPELSFIASLWARLRIADLADRMAWTSDPDGELARQIRETALEHSLTSEFTAFVAVDASEQTAGTHGTTVHQAVPVPDGVRYETTVGAP
ncbi:MAG TPA: VIT and VWA domain-containing protein [Gammaproteobacteria bacterium]